MHLNSLLVQLEGGGGSGEQQKEIAALVEMALREREELASGLLEMVQDMVMPMNMDLLVNLPLIGAGRKGFIQRSLFRSANRLFLLQWGHSPCQGRQ